MRLFTANEKRIRSFLFASIGSNESVDELMQEVSVVLWKKFAQLDDDQNFLKWAYVVARYELLQHRRRFARNRLVLDSTLMEQLSDQYAKREETSPDYFDGMKKQLEFCISQLPDIDQKTLLASYAGGQRIAEVAERMQVSARRLYKDLERMRRQLRRCIEFNLSQQ